MNVLLIDTDCTGLDLAYRAVAAGHKVRWYVAPHKDHSRVWDGDGFVGIEKVTSWKPHMAWAKTGLIVNLFNDKKVTSELDSWRDFNMPVFGPSAKSAELERNRGLGMKFMQKHGIDVPINHTFKTLDEVIKFAWKADQPYVFKTLGDEEDKSLSYVASDPADLVGWLETKKKQGLKLKGECVLQEKIDKICDIGVSGWVGKEGFLPGKFNINFEHKKLMPGDFGPNTGEMGCYDRETEVLTRSGWKFWPDVTMDDKLAALVDGKTVFEKPSAVVSYDYVGPMVCWENQTLDICVTPNHNMYVNSQFDARRGDDDGYKFVQAENCTQSQYEVMRTADWDGESPQEFTIDGYEYRKGLGSVVAPDIRVPMIEWARFIGLYIAEGCSSGKGVNIAQSHPEKCKKVEIIIAATGIPYVQRGHGFDIDRTQIARHLKPLGRSWEKRVPLYIKDGSTAVIEAFLDGYATGDGNMQPNGFRVFYSSNEALAGDVQELLLKVGRLGVIKARDRVGRMNAAPDGHSIVCRRVAYEVIERVKKLRSWIDSRDRSLRQYAGKVYCATVSSHIMYVRRNGKPLWCGNTVCKYVEESVLADTMLKPFEESLVKLGHIGDFDIECGIDSKGKAWPYEFSARFGWPSTQILMACHTCDPVEWMKDALSGKDTLEVDYRVAIGVLMAGPPFPTKNEDPQASVGAIVSGIEDVWDHVSPWQIMLDTGPVMQDGKIKNGEVYKRTGDYVCVVTALGADVHDVIPEVYAAVDKIKYSDRIVRNDIGVRLEKELPKLKALGYDEVPDW